jgi:hypothetical protein
MGVPALHPRSHLPQEGLPAHAGSCRGGSETCASQRLSAGNDLFFEAALAAPGKATVVASVVEVGDQRLIKSLFRTLCGDASNVDLVIVRIAGTGKRDALAYGFRAIARRTPADDDVVAALFHPIWCGNVQGFSDWTRKSEP